MDSEFVGELERVGYVVNEAAHALEWSIEAQLPFVQMTAPNARVQGWYNVTKHCIIRICIAYKSLKNTETSNIKIYAIMTVCT